MLLTFSLTFTIKGADYCCIIYDVGKSDAIHLLENSVLDDNGYI